MWIRTVLLFMFVLTAKAGSDIEIGGLVVDQTFSRIGHLFYQELMDGWDPPNQADTITIRELPDLFAGNIVSIEVNDNIVFQDRIGSRPSGIEEKAKDARTLLEKYLQQNKEAMQELEVY